MITNKISNMPEEKKLDFFKDYSALMLDVATLNKNAQANPVYKSGYVPLKDVLAEAKRVCLSNNFIFIQVPEIDNDKPVLATYLRHISGMEVIGVMPLVAKDLNDPQKIGGALTYMRRYSLTCILGIQEVDDDGNEASNAKTKSTNGLPF